MLATTYRSYSAMIGLLIVLAGLFLVTSGIVLHLFAATPAALARSTAIQWVWIAGGGVFVLMGVFGLGVALGRREMPRCPHCDREVAVGISMWSGRVVLEKPVPKKTS